MLAQRSQLNAYQREAVLSIDGACLVLAGAGSGKTSVITHKIAYLIHDCGLSAHRIAAVTFTNKAAREMRERLNQLLPKKMMRGLTLSTFHTLGLNILRAEGTHLGYRKGFSLFDQQDSQQVLSTLDIAHDQLNLVHHRISDWKNRLITPDEALRNADNEISLSIAKTYGAYQQCLKAYNALDFDDLIMQPVQLFQQYPDILARWQHRIQYWLVDEYQDTNGSQYQLLKLLWQSRQTFTVVGDDDQSIYAWRGAQVENLNQLQQDFPQLAVIKLEQNYRSSSLILKAANALIAHNPHLFTKQLWSHRTQGELIRVIRLRNEELEAERVASELLTRRLKLKARWQDFAVLYRGNFQAKLLELKLQHYQIPYKISGGNSFFSRHEIKDAIAYLRLLFNPDDDAAFLRIVNVPRREIGPVTLEKLGEYAAQRELSLWQSIQEFGIQQFLNERACLRLKRFQQLLESTREQMARTEPIKVLREFFIQIDYSKWLEEQSSAPSIAERRLKNVYLLLEQLEKTVYKREKEAAEILSNENALINVEAAVARLVLQDIIEQKEAEEDQDKVQLLTLHAAKGLEFPHVYLLGLEEALLPHRNAIELGDIDEERRLAYVGMTRAQYSLTLTLARERKSFGELVACQPSRFLKELPEDIIEWEGFNESQTIDQQYQRGKTALADLRALLQ